jgi:trehalose 6-phosphate synthase
MVGFQTPIDCRNFVDTVERTLGAEVDRQRNVITFNGHRTSVQAYPVSVEWPNRWVRESAPIETCRATVRRELGLEPDALLGVGVDRFDYTKGITEKFLAIQIAEPSREQLPAYRELRTRVLSTYERINRRFGTGSYRPLILREERHEPSEVFRFLRAGDLCYVGSLHDGMNLVAKEFVCARDDERGVLVLSEFAGAAQQLAGALCVDPHDVARAAAVIAQALRMSAGEQAIRMRAMRANVAEYNTYWWAGRLLEDAARLRRIDPGIHGSSSLGHRVPA